MRYLLFLFLLILNCYSKAAYSVEFPVVGSYGFDWLKPKTAQCKRIAQSDADKFKKCEYADTGAFGLPLAYHACRVSNRSEFIILNSRANCIEALETMKANAP